MKTLITFLALLISIGMVSAVTIDNTYNLKNFGNAIGFKNGGTIQAADLYATDDLKVGDDGQVLGDLAVTGAISAGTGVISSGVYDGDFRLAANHSFYSTTGSGGIDWSNGTGAWKMPTGTGTIGSATTDFNGAITCRNITLDNNYHIVQGGTGAFTSGTGAFDINGALTTKGITQDSGYSLAQSGASGITVGTTGITASTSPLNLLENVTIAANKSISMASGSGAVDYSTATGTFKTPTGAITIGSGAVGITGTATFSKTVNYAVNASTTVSTTLTSSSTKTVYGIDAHSANVTLTLPDAATVSGRAYHIGTNYDPGSYYVKITATGSDKLGGTGGFTIAQTTDAKAGMTLESDGTLYIITGAYGTWAEGTA